MLVTQHDQPPIRKLDSWAHQADAYWFAADRPATMLAMGMGCVDCETEFLSPAGWKRIDEWDGEDVAQFDPETKEMSFVQPTKYIKRPSRGGMIRFKHARGLDQVLSRNHRVLWYDHNENAKVSEASEIARRGHGTAHARFWAACNYTGGEGIGLSEAELRLTVAVIADGHFPCKSSRCVVRIKKIRKIKRLKTLLQELDAYYHLHVAADGFHAFAFNVPLRIKNFDERFWKASRREREIICDEAPHWDGSTVKSGAVKFFSTSKASADFIQFCFASTGRRASLSTNKRLDRKSTDYVVHAVGNGRSSNYVHFAIRNGNAVHVPSSDGYKYCFQVPNTFLVLRRNGQIFTTGNTGKSKVAVDLVCNWGCMSTLILCPKSVLAVWRREIDLHAGTRIEVLVLNKGTGRGKVAKGMLFVEQTRVRGIPAAVVANYDTARTEAFARWSLNRPWDCVILDESHRAKGATTLTSKYVGRLGRVSHRRLCLTGTPMPHSPLDLFGQYRFLDPSIFGKSWHQFHNFYSERNNPAIPQMVTGFCNQEDLQQRMASIAFRVGTEVLDLPDVQHHVRPCSLSPKCRRIYDELEREFIAAIEGGVVTASNALVKTLRLRQAVSGFAVEEETKQIIEIDDAKERLLADLLADIGEPVVVFGEFRHDLDAIGRVAKSLGLRYGELSGRANDLDKHGCMPEGIDVLGVQYQSGGVGIDLTRVRYAIYYSPTYNLGNYEQSLARTHRPGQAHKVNYYHLVAEGTVDEKVTAALQNKRNVIDAVMAVFDRCEEVLSVF